MAAKGLFVALIFNTLNAVVYSIQDGIKSGEDDDFYLLMISTFYSTDDGSDGKK